MKHSGYLSLRILPCSLLLTICGECILCSCSQKVPDRLDEEAHSLFKKSAALIRAYTDSMGRASDSAAWATLSNNYDDRLARLNFEYPADTDLHLTEGENDTLYMLNSAFVKARCKAEERIFRSRSLPDSIAAADSIKK